MAPPAYTPYHPRWLRTRTSTWWWLGKWAYLRFILRELSSVAVAWIVAYLVLLVRAIAQGPVAYETFVAEARAPFVLGANLVALAFVVFHAVTWFDLAPKAMVVRIGGRPVPGLAVALAHYALWGAVSVALVRIAVGG